MVIKWRTHRDHTGHHGGMPEESVKGTNQLSQLSFLVRIRWEGTRLEELLVPGYFIFNLGDPPGKG